MKKYIVTESQLKSVLNSMVTEQSNPNVFDSQGVIGTDGNLYIYSESWDIDKIGPINGVPYVGDVYVQISKKQGGDVFEVSKGVGGNLGLLKMKSGYTWTRNVKPCSIQPTIVKGTELGNYITKFCKTR